MVVASQPYYVLLLNQDRVTIGMFELAEKPRFTRKVNTATEVSLTLPRDEQVVTGYILTQGGDTIVTESGANFTYSENKSKLPLVELAHYMQIYHGNKRKVSGVIARRDVGETYVKLSGYTEEILLTYNQSPRAYGQVYQNLDLADAVRQSLDGWYTLNVTSVEDWDTNIDRSDVDLTTEPGQVLLSKPINVYLSDGHITLRFDKTRIPNFKAWDRVRWLSDYDDVVQTTMAYRYSNTAITDPNQGWSQELVGGLPDTLGVAIAATTERYVDVRMTLVTQDTESQSEETQGGQFQYGVTPRVFALQVIVRTESGLVEGTIPITTGKLVRSIDADSRTQFEIIKQACEQADYTFTVVNGAVSIKEGQV